MIQKMTNVAGVAKDKASNTYAAIRCRVVSNAAAMMEKVTSVATVVKTKALDTHTAVRGNASVMIQKMNVAAGVAKDNVVTMASNKTVQVTTASAAGGAVVMGA